MDIVDGDNAAEIAGEQRGLMMTLLASERANKRIERVARGQGPPPHSPPRWSTLRAPSSSLARSRFPSPFCSTPCVSHGIIPVASIATPASILVN